MHSSFCYRSLLILLSFLWCLTISAQQQKDVTKRSKLNLGVEYYKPLWENREINTLNLNSLYVWEDVFKFPLHIGAGVTICHAWGMQQDFDENYVESFSDNNVFGFGPMFLLGIDLKLTPFISFTPEFTGAFMLYTERFPVKGDLYNFMWRMGASFTYAFKKGKYGLSIPIRWMHVSNGKGVTAKNPSYEGFGTGVTIIKYLN